MRDAGEQPNIDSVSAASFACLTGRGDGVASATAGGGSSSDVYARLATSTSAGRGSLTGWAACPLCPARSSKRFSLGRGLTAHLHAVHTPWRLGKSERKRRTALRKKAENLRRRKEARRQREKAAGDEDADSDADADAVQVAATADTELEWTPTPEEVAQWGQRVAALAAEVEAAARNSDRPRSGPAEAEGPTAKRRKICGAAIPPGRDRTGRAAVVSYRASLPPFLAVAADGDVVGVRALLEKARKGQANGGGNVAVRALLDLRDRHGATAEHWAAGGGHLECLQLLHAFQRNHSGGDGDGGGDDSVIKEERGALGRPRRRDGKSPLHYAARNGRDAVITYLLGPAAPSSPAEVDAPAGDGTTPLHLACYGAHLGTARLLVERYQADPARKNEWGCGTAHWAAMSTCEDPARVLAVCDYLRWECGVPFHARQNQGHSPVHKAAQKQRRDVIEWLARGKGQATQRGAGMSAEEKEEAGRADAGGRKPSDIWNCVGGCTIFEAWMRKECSW